MTSRQSVWLLTNLPSPYQVDLFTAIHQQDSLELDVRFMRAPKDEGAAVGFNYRVLWSPVPAKYRDELRLHPHAVWETAFSKHDCYVLSGIYTSITFLLCALVLTIRRKPWAMWLERPRPQTSARPWSNHRVCGAWTDWLRRRVLRGLLRRCDRVICIGSAAVEDYASRYAAPREKLVMLPYCCDGMKFVDVPAEQVVAIRARYGLDGRRVYLYSGQLIERKGVDVLLAAFGRLAETHPKVSLLLLGDGKLRDKLVGSVPEAIRSQTHFVGFVEQAALPAYFAAADVFVFPSRHDGWGCCCQRGLLCELAGNHDSGGGRGP